MAGAGKKVISQDILDMLYLISCALHDEEPDENVIRSMNLQNVFQISMLQSLSSITFMGLQKSKHIGSMEQDLIRKWGVLVKQSLRKIVLLDIEREKLSAYLEEQQIWFMPLKGSILQKLYPVYGMRQMSDNDILFDAAHRKDIRAYMEENGFETVEYEQNHHDVYMKPPIYNFEMHTELFGRKNNPVWQNYYSDVKSRLKLKDGKVYEYCFTDEDFYIYQILHSYKHYRLGGTGLRHILDTFVFLSSKKDTMDREYLRHELDTLEAHSYAVLTEALCYKIFSKPRHFQTEHIREELTNEEFDMLYVMSLADTYGTHDSMIEADFEKAVASVENQKIKKYQYYLRRAFPDDEWWRRKAPFCYRHVWARPFYNFYRLIRGVTVRRKKLAHEIAMVNEKLKAGDKE